MAVGYGRWEVGCGRWVVSRMQRAVSALAAGGEQRVVAGLAVGRGR